MQGLAYDMGFVTSSQLACLHGIGASCTTAHFHSTVSSDEEVTDTNILPQLRSSASRNPTSTSRTLFPHRRPTCVWCPSDQRCSSKSHKKDAVCQHTTKYEFNCPLAPRAYPAEPPTLLPDWMGHFLNATTTNNQSSFVLTDLTLPGTHDSFTYDLSLTVSDDGLDDMQALAALLHFLSPGGSLHILPGDLEEFFRLQAKTQQLTITQQLDNGIRFIDCRIMMQQDPVKPPWYSIHFMQSKQTVEIYWKEMRQWLDEHPQEVVMIWLSKHGSPQATGGDQYTGVTKEQKKEIWTSYMTIFDGLLMDARVSGIHTTPVSVLVERNHRVITLATDYVEFTESSPWALDAAMIHNTYEKGDGIFGGIEPYLDNHKHYFHRAKANNEAARSQGGFTLLGLNTQGPSWLIEAAAQQRFLPLLPGSSSKCDKNIHLDGIDSWCPRTLLDVAQLSAYYNQVSINRSFEDVESSTFPMAFYLDSLDYDGTIRTGSQLLDGYESPGWNAEHASDSYAYVDTVLAYNAHRVCSGEENNESSSCTALMQTIKDRRSRHPVNTWSEAKYGRSEIDIE